MDTATIGAAFFVAAILYSAVGHGGASAYLAIMALASFAPEQMKPISLTLNLVVSALALWRFSSVGAIDWRLLGVFVACSIPMAFIGGVVKIDPALFKQILGVMLVLSALALFFRPVPNAGDITAPKLPIAAGSGGALGLIAGLTGTGGGIFLSPLLVLMRWVDPKKSAGIAAGFVFCNSASGLAGNIAQLGKLPPETPLYAAIVALGGLLGSHFSAAKLPRKQLLQLLALVLLAASVKLILG